MKTNNTTIKYIFILGISLQIGFSETITLNKILRSANKQSSLSQSLKQNMLAQTEKNLADTALKPLELYTQSSMADPQGGQAGLEYTFGVSKNIQLENIQHQEQFIARLNNQADNLEAKSEIINFNNKLKNLYHQNCIDIQSYESFKQSYNDLEKLYKKKEKSYSYEEISKMELVQIKSEKNYIYAKLQEMKMMKIINKNKLFELSKINYSKENTLSCKDMYPINTTLELNNIFSLSKKAHQKRLYSTQKQIKRYSYDLESIDVSVEYTQEIDAKKYTINASLPLVYSSKKSEHEKASAMYKRSALKYNYRYKMLKKNIILKELKAKLKIYAIMIKTLLINYKNYKKSVLPLINKSYDLGETSVIEYLLNRQKLYELSQEVYAKKKAYYNTLFKLYALSQKKD
jgi:hypothetical protein